MQASNQPTAGGEVKLPIKAAGAASDAVILHAAHEDQESELKTLAMGTGLVVVVGLARSTEVKMPRLQGCRAVRDVDGALTVAAFVADVT